MELTFSIIDNDQDWAVEHASELLKQIASYVPEAEVEQLEAKMAPGKGGGVFESVLKIVLGQSFLEKVLDLIKTAIENIPKNKESSKTEFEFAFKNAEGKEVSIKIKGKTKADDIKVMMGEISKSL